MSTPAAATTTTTVWPVFMRIFVRLDMFGYFSGYWLVSCCSVTLQPWSWWFVLSQETVTQSECLFCSVVNALKYEVFGESAIGNGSVASVGIWDGRVCFCENWDHTNWVNTTTCASHWRIKEKTCGSCLPPSREPAPPFPLHLSPLLCAPFFLNLLFFFSSLSSGKRRSSPVCLK